MDTYLDALKDFPRSDVKLKTEKGTAVCQKTDIFKGLLWFAYEKEGMNWHELDLDKVNEIIAINKKGNTVTSLEEYVEEVTIDTTELFNNVVGQDSLTRFDAPKGQRNKKKRNNRKRKPATAGASEDKGGRPPRNRNNQNGKRTGGKTSGSGIANKKPNNNRNRNRNTSK